MNRERMEVLLRDAWKHVHAEEYALRLWALGQLHMLWRIVYFHGDKDLIDDIDFADKIANTIHSEMM